MPIKVQYGGGDIGALVQLASLAGAANRPMPQIQLPRGPAVDVSYRTGGGGGRGGRTGSTLTLADYGRIHYPSAGERMAEEETRRKEYERKVVEQEEARKRAIPIDYKYTQRQRAEIAKYQNAKQDLMRNPRFSDEEKATLSRELDAHIDAIQPIGIPRDPSQPQYPVGRGPGDEWKDEYGNIKTMKPNGEVITAVEYKDTREGIAAAHDRAVELEQIKNKQAFMDKIAAARARIATTQFTDANDVKRYPTPAETWHRLQVAYPPSTWPTGMRQDEISGYKLEEELEKRLAGEQPMRRPAVQAMNAPTPAFNEVTSDMSLKFTEQDQDLPERVRTAQAFLREAKRRGYLEKDAEISFLMEKAIQEALQIGAAYNAIR